MNIIAEIPARGGSKGVPRKALQKIGHMPLIAYTIRDALAIHGITKVFVNTDDLEIREVSIEYGAEVPFLRPEEMARDDSNLADAHVFARQWYKENENFDYDVVVVMSPTHPFRRKNLVNNALQLGTARPDIFNVGSVHPVNIHLDNYWINSNNGFEKFQFPCFKHLSAHTLYQNVFSFNIVFYCRSNLYDRRVPFPINDIEAVDIDEPKDLEIARMIVAEGLYPIND